jgi:signal transduction histidine kinase/CheY-like chemotaxis protein
MKRLFMIPKVSSVKLERLVFILSEISIISFAVFRILDMASGEGIRLLPVLLIASPLAMLVIALIYLFKRTLNQAFFMPLALYLVFLGGCFLANNFMYFFSVCLGICCLGAVYLDQVKLRNYIIISNIVSLVLVFLKIPVTYSLRPYTFSEMMMQWSILVFCSLFIYLITAFAVDKNNAATKARDSFTALLSSTQNRIVLLDSKNRITYISDSFMDLTSLKHPADAVGRPLFDILADAGIRQMFQDVLKTESPHEAAGELILSGRQCYFDITTNNLAGETKGRLINIIDITPVMRAKLEAEAASRSKSDFLAAMSHEIRTPLNAVIGLSEIELQKKLSADTRTDLEKIHNSGSSLLAIINNILDISKIEAGSFELVPADYDVPSLINDTIHLNIVRIGSKQISFKLEIDHTVPVRLFGDEVRVRQVLNNLLSNAFKYTESGTVVLGIAWERRGDEALVSFRISDTGRGIRKEDIPRVFNEYAQLDTRANHHIEGTGLGLSITKNLVELMGGTISLESEFGRGSVFTVRIPQKIVDEKPIGETTADNLRRFHFMENRRRRGFNLMRAYMPYGRVLVVDDVETNLDVARGLLLPYGLSIDCASSGPEAIEKIRAVAAGGAAGDGAAAAGAGVADGGPRYDLVLMDHMMPGMDGIEAVQIIRNEIDSDYARTVPIIALTANALAGNDAIFISHGFTAFISKPIDIMQLDTALNTWVKDKQSQDTLLQAEMERCAAVEEDSGALTDVFIDGVDLARGTERYRNAAVYLDVLRSYYIHTPPLLEKLRAISGESGPAPDKNTSLTGYIVAVHGIKGSSYGVCADAVGRDAEALERAARAGDIERVQADNGPFIEKVELLLEELEKLLRKTEAGREAKQKASAPEKETLQKLLDAAKGYKAPVMEEALAALESREYETGGDLVAWLREQVDNLEYDAIRERLENRE